MKLTPAVEHSRVVPHPPLKFPSITVIFEPDTERTTATCPTPPAPWLPGGNTAIVPAAGPLFA